MLLPPFFDSSTSSVSNVQNSREPGSSEHIATGPIVSDGTAQSSNLEAKNPSDDHKSSKTAKEDNGPSSTKNFVEAVEVKAGDVPDPAPDTGSAKHLTIHTGVLPVIPSYTPTTLTISPYTLSASGLSTLPTLAVATTSQASGTVSPTRSPDDTSRALGAGQSNRSGGVNPKHILSTVGLVLLSVGAVALLVGCFVTWKIRRRPHRRTCPTPSLPILQDPFADADKYIKADDESLFGGKEHSSALARPNSDGLYPWVQYTPKSSQALSALGNKTTAPNPPPIGPLPSPPPPPPSALVSQRGDQTLLPIHIPLPLNNTSSNSGARQMQQARNRASNRISAMSMSIYPMSPQSSHTNTGIGLAISSASPLTADGTPVLERKSSRDKLNKSRQSYRHSVAATTEFIDIYDGAQIFSPAPPPSMPFVPPSVKSAMRKSTSIHASGRARVKAGYTPGASSTVLRASSTVTGVSSLARANNRISMAGTPGALQHVLPPLSAIKSDAHRERDTRALTSALGLGSPSPMSPAMTLGPDDSITLAGDRDRRRSRSCGPAAHRRGPSEALLSPMTETSARLGNLLLEDYANMSLATLPSAHTVGAGAGFTASASKSRVVPRKNVNAGTRADDRPPRVPSPPPLPSLAQMAMAHTNPDEYADYRSPTYSIYGLYEAERKSRVPGSDIAS